MVILQHRTEKQPGEDRRTADDQQKYKQMNTLLTEGDDRDEQGRPQHPSRVQGHFTQYDILDSMGGRLLIPTDIIESCRSDGDDVQRKKQRDPDSESK